MTESEETCCCKGFQRFTRRESVPARATGLALALTLSNRSSTVAQGTRLTSAAGTGGGWVVASQGPSGRGGAGSLGFGHSMTARPVSHHQMNHTSRRGVQVELQAKRYNCASWVSTQTSGVAWDIRPADQPHALISTVLVPASQFVAPESGPALQASPRIVGGAKGLTTAQACAQLGGHRAH